MRSMRMAIILILAAGLFSCSKEHSLETFTEVKVGQGGESVMIEGYLHAPLDYDFSYSVQVDECGVKTDRLVIIRAGETYGFLHYQTNCKIGKWDITYRGPLIQ